MKGGSNKHLTFCSKKWAEMKLDQAEYWNNTTNNVPLN